MKHLFFWDLRAPGSFLADSPENFSTERPDFVAFRPPPCHNGGTQNFEPNFWRIPRCSFSSLGGGGFSVILGLIRLCFNPQTKQNIPNIY